jgi:predicted metalloprotease with PDZ domain
LSPTVSHRLVFPNPQSHLVDVETTVRAADPFDAPLTLFMPVWTPGSYLVREYARHVEGVTADAPATVTKVRKNAWRVDARGERTITVRYRVYCNDLTVRTNHVDETHAYLNGAPTFLAVEGHEAAAARVEIDPPAGWRVSTALPRASGASADRPAFEARDLDTLVDSPIEVGTHREDVFDVMGKTHRYAIWPRDAAAPGDVERLVRDTRTIMETEAKLFGGSLPYDDYLFILHLSPRGRGGLEHRSSATLLAPPTTFATRDGYLDLLSLVSHEAFHAWNVKRLRPQGLFPYRYQEENYTRLLWWFEGATSYYDWRVLRLAKLCSVSEYLEHLANEILYCDQTYGRLVHPLEGASFDAWIKLYRPDENSSNSSVSYYRKGELVIAMLDLEIRARSKGRASMDTVLRWLWENHGAREVPVPEDGMQDAFERATDVKLGDLFDAWVRGATEIDYAATLAKHGLGVERSAKPDGPQCSLGTRLRSEGGRTIVTAVTRGAAAHRGGIDPGDEIIAIGGRRVEGVNLDGALAPYKEGTSVEAIIARDGRVHARQITLDGPRLDRVRIVAREDASAEAKAAFTAWLGDPHPSWESA